MKEVYIADDGKMFEDKKQCESYEYCELKFPLLNNIKFIDKNNKILSFKEKRVDEEAFYIDVEKIIINNKEELNQLRAYAEDCGFVSWQKIDAIGAWEWNEKEWDFVPCVSKCIYATKFDDEVYYIGYNSEVRCFDVKGSTGKIGRQSLREAGNCFKERKDAEAQARAERLIRQLKMFANWHDTGKLCGGCYIKYVKKRDELIPEIIDAKGFVPFGSVVFCSLTVAFKAIDEFRDELLWYFKDYMKIEE